VKEHEVSFRDWLNHPFVSFRRWLRPLKAVTTEDIPDRLDGDQVYLIGDDGLIWQAAFLCPCGCRETIQLSLLEHDKPRWRVEIGPSGIITLAPSIWRQKGCRSHFFVRNGQIRWA
jgi:hypothetical protein